MPLIYITGPSGSGKSTICNALREQGYEVFDTDTDKIRYWIDEETGKPIKPFEKGAVENKQWMNDHKLGLSMGWLEKLKEESMDKLIFICGTSPVDHVDSGIYDKIILLNINEQALINRLRQRTDNQYGKEPVRLEKAIKWRSATLERYRKAGAQEIDAMLPLPKVVAEIIEIASRL